MASGPVTGRPRLAWLVLAVAVVVVVVVAVLVVRSVRSPEGAIAASSSPTAGAGGSAAAPSGGPTSPSRSSSSTSSQPTSSSSRPTSSPTMSRSTSSPDPKPTTGPRTKSPAPLDRSETVDQGLTARVSKLEAVAGKAQGPGEISGPALRTSITLTNRSGRTLDLSNTVVNLFYGAEQLPASVLSGPGARALPTSVKDDQQASGRYVFAVPADQRAEVLITVDYSVKTPIVAFRGKAPR